MDLYDVKAPAFHCPLNCREIDRLYRAGVLGGRQACKPKGEARWQTIDELFPLLKYEADAPPLRFEDPAKSQRRRRLVSICALLLALLGAVILHSWVQSAPPADTRQPIRQKSLQAAQPAVVSFTSFSSGTFTNRSAIALDPGVVMAEESHIR
ncbi:MAG: hypothetical protein ACREIF_16050 [Chthoniobacterales bacterium]